MKDKVWLEIFKVALSGIFALCIYGILFAWATLKRGYVAMGGEIVAVAFAFIGFYYVLDKNWEGK